MAPIKVIKHSVSVIKTSQLMRYREIIAVFSQIHTKHINTLCGQNVEIFNVKIGGKYSNRCVLSELHNVLQVWSFSLWDKPLKKPAK